MDEGHPFYSKEAIAHWKKRCKELGEEEKALEKKKKPRKDTPEQGTKGVEERYTGESGA